MKVNENILTGVAYVGCRKADGAYLLKGSVFFLGLEPVPGEPEKIRDILWITARHVIDGIRTLGCTAVYIRLNTKSGGSRWHLTNLAEWFCIKDDQACDIAVYSRPLPDDADHSALSLDNLLSVDIQQKLAF